MRRHAKHLQVVYGRRTVVELLRRRSATVREILLSRDLRTAQELVDLARRAGIDLKRVEKAEIEGWAQGEVHQGVVALVEPRTPVAEGEIVAGEGSGIVVLVDQVSDPHNLGAILRACDGAGVQGVILPEHGTAPLSSVARKASAGASECIPVAKAVNFQRTIGELKRRGYWVIGTGCGTGTAVESLFRFRFPERVALVVGSEGSGIRRLTARECDVILTVPLFGAVDSLNVAQATAIVLFELRRQREDV